MLKFNLLFILLILGGVTFGQVIEKVVAISQVSYSRQTASEADAVQLYNYILNSLHRTQRLQVVDRLMGQDEIVKEKTIQQNVDFVEGHVVDQGQQVGADYVIVTHVNSVGSIAIKDSSTDEILGYEGNLSLFFRVLSVKTGKVIASAIVTPDGSSNLEELNYETGATKERAIGKVLQKLGNSNLASSPEGAIRNSMNSIEPTIRAFIDGAFPLEMKIADIQEVQHRKKISTEVFILGGTSTGLRSGDNLNIMEIVERTIGGKTFIDEVNVGKLKVLRVNEDLVVCKIVNQSKAVIETFAELPDSLKVVYTPTTNIFGL